MKKILTKTLLGVCTVSVLVGCASKDVILEDKNQKSDNTIEVSSKLDNINGTERAVADGSLQSSQNMNAASTSTLTSVSNSSVNTVKSEIEGEDVILESVHFSFDKFKLSDKMRAIATNNYSKIDIMSAKHTNMKIKLEGNCDEWGTDEYNYALGLKRAKTTKDALIADGIDASKILLVSFGESNPVCNQKDSACWKMNRRVDYRLLP